MLNRLHKLLVLKLFNTNIEKFRDSCHCFHIRL